jgi:uncharacterized protein YciI
MFIAVLKYTRPIDEIESLLPKHREYLERLFRENKLLICGRLNPRTGGIIITKNISREEFEEILKNDPFVKVSEFQIIEFLPTLYDDCLKKLIGYDE